MSLYEFESEYTYDSGDTSITGTGSGVHLYKDVSFTFDILDRSLNTINNSIDINRNSSIGDMAISILDTGGSVVYPNYYSGAARRTFTFKEQENIDVFGSYQKDFGILVDLQDNTAGAFDAEFYVYGNCAEIRKVIITDGGGTSTYQNYIGIEWSGAGVSAVNPVLFLPPDGCGISQVDYSVNNVTPLAYWALNDTGAKFTLNDFATGGCGSSYSLSQYGAATGYVTAPDDTNLTLTWNAVNISESQNAGYDVGTVYFNGTGIFTGESVGDVNGITPNYTYGNGTVSISSGTNLEIVVEYDTRDENWQDRYFGIEFNATIEPNPVTTITSTGGSPITGYMIADVEFLNNPAYTRFKNIDVYTGTSAGIVESRQSFLRQIPILTQENVLQLEIYQDDLDVNTEYYFRLVPNSEVCKGEALEIGPHKILPQPPIPNILEGDLLIIREGEEESVTDLVTGEITGTGATIIDTVPTGGFAHIDYLIRINDSNSETHGSKLSVVITGDSGTGHSFGEYAISANSDIIYTIDTDANNVYLKAQVDDVPATFKFLKTSI
jgi:hypothetical protein